MGKVYAAIDLKSFYASVECAERGLDPLTTNLVVANAERTEKTICLAISPSLKSYGLPGRARLFEVNQKVYDINYSRKLAAPEHRFIGKSINNERLLQHPELELSFLIAPPRMSKYVEVSQKIYDVYLQFLAPDDIFAYSIDEIFCDLTSYLKMYQSSARDLVTKIITAVYQTTGITATAGIGTNMYLAKIAMDILAKHAQPNALGVRIAELDEMSYREQLWHHQPITDFWRIGPGTAKRLRKNFMYTMGDVARCSLNNEDLLYKTFGVNAELLIDHAWGYESVEITDAKRHIPKSKSLNHSQVLAKPYDFAQARTIVDEMSEVITLEMMGKNFTTDQLVLHISYDVSSMSKINLHPDIPITKDRHGRNKPKSAHGTWRLNQHSDLLQEIRAGFLELYDQYVCPDFSVRKVSLTVANLHTNHTHVPRLVQTSLFDNTKTISSMHANSSKHMQTSYGTAIPTPQKTTEQQRNLQIALTAIRQKYGKNAILRGANFADGATGRQRNHQIGGHQE